MALALSIKMLSICCSLCFLVVGILFEYKATLLGGYLWLVGSWFYLLGSIAAFAKLTCRDDNASGLDCESLASSRDSSMDIESDEA